MKNGVNVFFLLDLKFLLHLTWRNQIFVDTMICKAPS